MAKLNDKPGSSSKAQHTRLVIAGRKTGLTLAEIRKAVGGSIRKLSAAEASKWIEHFTGRGLPNPPGQKPKAYEGKPAPGVIRMITNDQIKQIGRLALDYFANQPDAAGAARSWLVKNFKVRDPRDLLTAQRAGQVVRVLKDMHERRRERA